MKITLHYYEIIVVVCKYTMAYSQFSLQYAFGSAGNVSIGVPPGAYLDYEIELCSFEKAKESWEMDQEEKIEYAKICKERGSAFFKQEKYRLAVKQYKKVLDFLQYDNGEITADCKLKPSCV